MRKQSIRVSMDQGDMAWLRLEAKKERMSVSQFVRSMVVERMRPKEEPAVPRRGRPPLAQVAPKPRFVHTAPKPVWPMTRAEIEAVEAKETEARRAWLAVHPDFRFEVECRDWNRGYQEVLKKLQEQEAGAAPPGAPADEKVPDPVDDVCTCDQAEREQDWCGWCCLYRDKTDDELLHEKYAPLVARGLTDEESEGYVRDIEKLKARKVEVENVEF